MQNKYYDMLNIFHHLIAFKMKMTTFFKLQKFMNGVTRDLIEDSKPIVLNYVIYTRTHLKGGIKIITNFSRCLQDGGNSMLEAK